MGLSKKWEVTAVNALLQLYCISACLFPIWPCLAGSASLGSVSTVFMLPARFILSVDVNMKWTRIKRQQSMNFCLGSEATEPHYRCESNHKRRTSRDMCERAGRENQPVEGWEWGLKASFSPCGSQRRWDGVVKDRERTEIEENKALLEWDWGIHIGCSQLDSAVWLRLRGLVRCQLVMTATYLFWGWSLDDSVCYQQHSPNSHHGLHSLLATMTPINDPAEHVLMIRQVEMTRRATEEGEVYLWKWGRVLHPFEARCPLLEEGHHLTRLLLRHNDSVLECHYFEGEMQGGKTSGPYPSMCQRIASVFFLPLTSSISHSVMWSVTYQNVRRALLLPQPWTCIIVIGLFNKVGVCF